MKSGLLITPVLLLSACVQIQEPYTPLSIDSSPRLGPEIEIQPPETGELGLETALLMAVHGNRDLQITRLDPERAKTEVMEEAGTFTPELFGSVQVGEEQSSESSRSTGEQFAVEREERRSEAGVRKTFSTGTDLELSVSEERDASNRSPTNQEIRAGVELTQPLLRGAGRETNLALLRQAELGVAVSQAQLSAYTQAVLADTEIAYWRTALAGKAVEITRTALEVAEQQQTEIRDRIEVGQLPSNQQAAVDAEVADRRQALIDAEAGWQDSQLGLKFLLALDPEYALQLVDEIELEGERIQDVQPFLERALQWNPELRQARLQLQRRELEVIRTRNGVMPRLDFFAALSTSGFGTTLSEAQDDFGGDSHAWMAGLRVLVELGESSETAQKLDAELAQVQAELAVDNLAADVSTRVRRAVVEHNRALAQVGAGRETVRLRERTAQAEQDRLEVGAGTSLLAAQAQRDLLESRIEDLRNQIAYRTARVRLLEVTGSLLDHYGLGLQDPLTLQKDAEAPADGLE